MGQVEIFLYCVRGLWHVKAVNAPSKGYKQKTGVILHITRDTRAKALVVVKRWRALFNAPREM